MLVPRELVNLLLRWYVPPSKPLDCPTEVHLQVPITPERRRERVRNRVRAKRRDVSKGTVRTAGFSSKLYGADGLSSLKL